jgi:regulator of sigma E protease
MSAIIQAIVIFFLLILVHEFGHYIVAKKSGTHVYEFAIGMGPLIRSFERNGTQYSIRLIPIGGYVRLEGEDEESDSPNGFTRQPPWKKFLILFAGAFMNFVFAGIIFFLLFSILGQPNTAIDQVIPDSAAAIHGLQSGDTIIEFQGVEIDSWDQLSSEIQKTTANQTISISLLREGAKISNSLQMGEGENGQGYLGIIPKRGFNFWFSLKSSWLYFWQGMGLLAGFFRELIQGKVGAEAVAGPVGIVTMIGEASQYGWLALLNLAGLISINLGFVNLLPIPALDGGRILFVLVEAIRRKPVPPEKEGWVHFIGFALMLGLLILITYQDLLRLLRP